MTKKKGHTVSIRVSEATYEAAEEKARSQHVTLSSVLRSFLHLWAHDETPRGYPPPIPELDKRAPEEQPRRPRNGRKKPVEE